VSTLVITGANTSGCVRASVVDGFSHGFKVIVVEDGVFDRTKISHLVNLLIWMQNILKLLQLMRFYLKLLNYIKD